MFLELDPHCPDVQPAKNPSRKSCYGLKDVAPRPLDMGSHWPSPGVWELMSHTLRRWHSSRRAVSEEAVETRGLGSEQRTQPSVCLVQSLN